MDSSEPQSSYGSQLSDDNRRPQQKQQQVGHGRNRLSASCTESGDLASANCAAPSPISTSVGGAVAQRDHRGGGGGGGQARGVVYDVEHLATFSTSSTAASHDDHDGHDHDQHRHETTNNRSSDASISTDGGRDCYASTDVADDCAPGVAVNAAHEAAHSSSVGAPGSLAKHNNNSNNNDTHIAAINNNNSCSSNETSNTNGNGCNKESSEFSHNNNPTASTKRTEPSDREQDHRRRPTAQPGPSSKSTHLKQQQHYATTTTPKIALQKLFKLEKLSGIWTQRMQIELQKDYMLVSDCETNIVVERFERHRVGLPEAFTEYNDIYKNIIVFAILPSQQQDQNQDNDSGESARADGEIHIFQCVSHKARDMVADMMAWRASEAATSAQSTTVGSELERDVQTRDTGASAASKPEASLVGESGRQQQTVPSKKLAGMQQQSQQQQPPKPVVTVASSSSNAENVPIVNVNVKETVQVFNQIAALREKSKPTSPTNHLHHHHNNNNNHHHHSHSRPLSDNASLAASGGAGSAPRQPLATANGASESASKRPAETADHSPPPPPPTAAGLYKQRSVRAILAPTPADPNTSTAAAAAAAAVQQAGGAKLSNSASSASSSAGSKSSGSRTGGQQHRGSAAASGDGQPGARRGHHAYNGANGAPPGEHAGAAHRPPKSRDGPQRQARGHSAQHESAAESRNSSTGGSQSQLDEQVSSNESYVSVLNHCFDDIEKFIMRLQQAVVAGRELHARKRSLKRSGATPERGQHLAFGEAAGAELASLASRARGPPEEDYFEILSKFKLAFNLLARLKGCIHDPNAPELVHFLFTPLAIIVESARNVAPPIDLNRVGIPYLNQDALDLLSNCCTSKEFDLWMSLGSNWTETIDASLLNVARLPSSFQPMFSDGWAPVICELQLIGLSAEPAHRLAPDSMMAPMSGASLEFESEALEEEHEDEDDDDDEDDLEARNHDQLDEAHEVAGHDAGHKLHRAHRQQLDGKHRYSGQLAASNADHQLHNYRRGHRHSHHMPQQQQQHQLYHDSGTGSGSNSGSSRANNRSSHASVDYPVYAKGAAAAAAKLKSKAKNGAASLACLPSSAGHELEHDVGGHNLGRQHCASLADSMGKVANNAAANDNAYGYSSDHDHRVEAQHDHQHDHRRGGGQLEARAGGYERADFEPTAYFGAKSGPGSQQRSGRPSVNSLASGPVYGSSHYGSQQHFSYGEEALVKQLDGTGLVVAATGSARGHNSAARAQQQQQLYGSEPLAAEQHYLESHKQQLRRLVEPGPKLVQRGSLGSEPPRQHRLRHSSAAAANQSHRHHTGRLPAGQHGGQLRGLALANGGAIAAAAELDSDYFVDHHQHQHQHQHQHRHQHHPDHPVDDEEDYDLDDVDDYDHEAILLDLGLAQYEWFLKLRSRGALVVRVLFTRNANNDKELSVMRGEILEVLDDSRKWWRTRNIELQVAHVPHTIVAVMHGYQSLDELLASNPGEYSNEDNPTLIDPLKLLRREHAPSGQPANYGASFEHHRWQQRDERAASKAAGAFRYF